MDGFQNMNISDYVTLMPEYQQASKNEKGFDFVAPIIVLEGMKFFDRQNQAQHPCARSQQSINRQSLLGVIE